MRRENFFGLPEYFKGTASDSLLRLIDTTLSNQSYDTLYLYNPGHGYIYDGFKYILDYQNNNKREIIQFIPPEAPAKIQSLSNVLDTLIFSNNLYKADTIDLKGYKDEVERLGKKIMKVPPPKKDTVKFIPVKIHRQIS